MPRRTNPFQQLVLLLHRQLGDDAIVKESDLLTDIATGAEVEVDITVATEVSSVPITIGVECTAEKRKATVEWVREMFGKHSTLPLNKTVLVSKSGFTADAVRLAAHRQMEALSLTEAADQDWAEFVSRNLTLSKTDFRAVAPVVTLAGGKKLRLPLGTRARFKHLEGTILEYVTAVLKGRDVLDEVLRGLAPPLGNQPEQRTGTFAARIDPASELEVEVDGKWTGVKHVEIEARVSVTNVRLDLEAAEIGQHQIAHTQVPNILSESPSSSSSHVIVNFLRGDQGLERASAIVPSTGGVEAEVYDFTIVGRRQPQEVKPEEE